jgi:hypothetical protein
MRRLTAARMLLFSLGAFALTAPCAQAQEEHTRGVHILDNAAPSSAAPAAQPLAVAPAPPTVTAPVPNVKAPPVALPAPPKELPAASISVENSAGVAIDILPGNKLHIGEKIMLRVSTKRAGYLVIVDVGANGKVTQLYPNVRSLMTMSRERIRANLIQPGHAIRIPNPLNPYAGFELVASPPTGIATVLAMLSERPVQVVDLPDVPATMVGRAQAVGFLRDAAQKLLIAAADGAGSFEPARWSFDAKFYAIR